MNILENKFRGNNLIINLKTAKSSTERKLKPSILNLLSANSNINGFTNALNKVANNNNTTKIICENYENLTCF